MSRAERATSIHGSALPSQGMSPGAMLEVLLPGKGRSRVGRITGNPSRADLRLLNRGDFAGNRDLGYSLISP
jgi:hypothetical protein